jgi:C4-dicarboxylate transporter DctQ subunit
MAKLEKKPRIALLKKIVDEEAWYNKLEANFGVILLFLMMFVMTFQVVQRFVFNSGNTWSEELARYMYIWFTLVTVSYAILRNAHIKVDACMSVFPKKARSSVVVLGLVIIIIYCFFMTKYGFNMVVRNISMGNISLGLKLPMYIVYIITPLSHILIAIRCVQRLIMIYMGKDVEALDEAEEAIRAAQIREERDKALKGETNDDNKMGGDTN